MRRVLLGCLTFGLLSGCAHPQAEGNPVGVNAGAATGVQGNLTETGLYGPDVSISRVPSGYRGQVLGEVIDLQWSRKEVFGSVGAGPTRLNWEPEGDGLRIRGLYAGRITDIQVGVSAINGVLGACTYDMKSEVGVYRGFQQCAGVMQRNTKLIFPKGMAGREPGEQVTLLALILGEYRSAAGGNVTEFAPPPPPKFWRGMYPADYRR